MEVHGESYSERKTHSSDFSVNFHNAVKMEEDETSLSSESPVLAIKSEEVIIISELPSEEADRPVAPTNSGSRKLFRCYLCDASRPFQDKNALRDHLLTSHPQQKRYLCSECSEHRADIMTYNQHLRRHDPILRPHKCQVCSLRFSKRNNQKQHEFDIHKLENGFSKRILPRRRVCPVCKKQFLEEHYDQHLLSEHSDAKLVCTICQEEFYTKRKLSQHRLFLHGSNNESRIKRNKEEGIFKCYMCKSQVLLDNHELLYQHLMDVHVKPTKYRCEECNYSCREITRFNNHLSRHDSSKKPSKCNICQVRLADYNSLRYHQFSAHNVGGSLKQYDCTICHKQLSSYRELSLHMRTHKAQQNAAQSETKVKGDENGKEEGSLSGSDAFPTSKCYLCNTVQENDATLKQHIAITHRIVDSGFKCTKCDFTHMQPITFNVHLRKHDSVVNPFKCTYCSLHFNKIRYRTFHEIMQHNHSTTPSTTNIESVRCYLCSTYTLLESKRALNRHLRIAHPAQTIHRCGQCKYTTKLKLTFNSHLEKHDPDCRFVCLVCSRDFPTRTRLLLHQRGAGHVDLEHSRSTTMVIYGRVFQTVNETPAEGTSMTKAGCPQRSAQSRHSETDRCKRCNYSTRQLNIFTNTCARHDRTIRPFKCRSCSQRFLTARYRKYHEVYLHENNSKNSSFCCTKCAAKFSFKYRLKLHMIGSSHRVSRTANDSSALSINNAKQLQQVENTKRTSVAISNLFAAGSAAKIYRCHMCSPNHVLDSRESLLQHLAALPGQDLYRCDGCSFSVNLVTMFNQHLAQHSTT